MYCRQIVPLPDKGKQSLSCYVCTALQFGTVNKGDKNSFSGTYAGHEREGRMSPGGTAQQRRRTVRVDFGLINLLSQGILLQHTESTNPILFYTPSEIRSIQLGKKCVFLEFAGFYR